MLVTQAIVALHTEQRPQGLNTGDIASIVEACIIFLLLATGFACIYWRDTCRLGRRPPRRKSGGAYYSRV